MKLLITLVVSLALSGCSTVKEWVPSFWDNNQSAKAVDIRYSIETLNCAKPHLPQAEKIEKEILWFQLYSESKGWRQQDVLKLVKPLQDTVTDFVKRSQTGEGTETYCNIKKKIMQTQAKRAAEAVLGRF
jgi:O6-methylguanine-DNA--protein-cysteine methyltransferase